MRNRKPIKVYERFVVVEGLGDFPLDMLRYDAAFPMSETDSNIAQRRRGHRRVALVLRGVNNLGPNEGRWRSFSWPVVGIFEERFEAEECRDKEEKKNTIDRLIASPDQLAIVGQADQDALGISRRDRETVHEALKRVKDLDNA